MQASQRHGLNQGTAPARRELLLLAVIVALGAMLRWVAAGAPANLWLDELFAMEWATGRGRAFFGLPIDKVIESLAPLTRLEGAPPWTAVWGSFTDDIQSPLYYMVLRAWMSMFGEGDGAVRSLSLVCATATIPALYAAVRRVATPAAGLFAAAIFAALPTAVMMAREVRPYNLLVLLCVLALWAFAAIVRDGATLGRLAALAVTLMLALLTQVLGLSLFLAVAGASLVCLRGRTRWLTLGAAGAGLLLFLAVWGPQMWVQWDIMRLSKTERWLREPWDVNRAQTPGRLLGLASRWVVDVYPAQISLVVKWLAALAAVGVTAYGAIRRELRVFALGLLCVVAVPLLQDVREGKFHLFLIRYTVVALPLMAALAGATVGAVRPRVLRWAIGGAVVAGLLAMFPMTARPMVWHEAYHSRQAAEMILQHYRRGDAVVVARRGPGRDVTCWFLPLNHYLAQEVGPIVLLESRATPEVAGRLAACREVWVLSAFVPAEEFVVLPTHRVASVTQLGGRPAGETHTLTRYVRTDAAASSREGS